MTDFEFQLDSFLLYCSSKNLSKKTLQSYEQALKLLNIYLEGKGITEVAKVKTGHIRQYLDHLGKRGKYTVVIDETKKSINSPEERKDFDKPLSATTKANYLRNIKVFFNWLAYECFLQVLFGESCKLLFHSIASPISALLQIPIAGK